MTVVFPCMNLRVGDIIEYQSEQTIRQARVIRQTHPDGGYIAANGAMGEEPKILDESNIIRISHSKR